VVAAELSGVSWLAVYRKIELAPLYHKLAFQYLGVLGDSVSFVQGIEKGLTIL
jgi:hypothetical protein